MTDVLNLQIPSPTFGGSTGGWLRAAETEEKYAITWTSKKEQVFEMPTSGAAIMQSGENLLYLAKKEQCLALSTQLRTLFKICLLYTSPSPRDRTRSRMPSSA